MAQNLYPFNRTSRQGKLIFLVNRPISLALKSAVVTMATTAAAAAVATVATMATTAAAVVTMATTLAKACDGVRQGQGQRQVTGHARKRLTHSLQFFYKQ